jgi:hypothetical protein
LQQEAAYITPTKIAIHLADPILRKHLVKLLDDAKLQMLIQKKNAALPRERSGKSPEAANRS